MAICARSSRQTAFTFENTPPTIGPGAYELDIRRKDAVATVAPFLTSSMRRPFEDTRKNPGPGDYKTLTTAPTNSGSLFGSLHTNASRFHVDKTTSKQSPGPGCYRARNAWLKKSFRREVLFPTSSWGEYSRSFSKSVPAIPTGQQCRGYIEHEDGMIALDTDGCPEAPVSDFPGPGSYDFSIPMEPRPKTMATFGRCRSDRKLFSVNKNPGPGYYGFGLQSEFSLSKPKGLQSVTDDDRMASFKSETKLAHQKTEPGHGTFPGPGEYSLDATKEEAIPEPGYTAFGSRQKRGYQEPADKEFKQWSIPGPGSYPCYSEFANVGLRRNIRMKAPGFQQSSKRFNGYETVPPGPGEYTALSNFGQRPHFKHNAKSGFSSSQTRDTGTGQMDKAESPGPAQYMSKPSTFLDKGKYEHGGMASSMFQSRVQRFKELKGPTEPDTPCYMEDQKVLRGDPRSLGPGCYNHRDSIHCPRLQKLLRSKDVPFQTSDTRFGLDYNKDKEMKPGPGAYSTQNPRWTHGIGQNHSSFPTSIRFLNNSPRNPGPGEYEAGRNMLSKSFNVTFD